MRNAIGSALIASAIAGAMVWTAPAVTAQGVSQIVLSCTTPAPESKTTNGCHSNQTAPIPSATSPEGLFVGGFWVWCQSPAGSSTPYGPDCAGSVYVAEIGAGGVTYEANSVDGQASLVAPHELAVEFTSSDGDISCTLNLSTSANKGGTLSGECNGVPISFGNAVINVTP